MLAGGEFSIRQERLLRRPGASVQRAYSRQTTSFAECVRQLIGITNGRT
jgi:hypothetical protein